MASERRTVFPHTRQAKEHSPPSAAPRQEGTHLAPSPIQHKSRPWQGSGFHFYYRVAMRTAFHPLASVQKPGRQRRGGRYSLTPGRPRSTAHRLPPLHAGRNTSTSAPIQHKSRPGKGAAFIFIIGWRCVPPSSRWLSSGSPGGSGRGNGIPVRPGRPDSQRTAQR